MSLVSIRLPEEVLQQTDLLAKSIHVSRTDYIRHAIEKWNAEMVRQKRAERLKKVSLRVRKESMKVNREFSRIEDDPET